MVETSSRASRRKVSPLSLIIAFLGGFGSAVGSLFVAIAYDEFKAPSPEQKSAQAEALVLTEKMARHRKLVDDTRLAALATANQMETGEPVSAVHAAQRSFNAAWSDYQSEYYDLKSFKSSSPQLQQDLDPVRAALYEASGAGAAIAACLEIADEAYSYRAAAIMRAANEAEIDLPRLQCRDQRHVFSLESELDAFDSCSTAIKFALGAIVDRVRLEDDDSALAKLRKAIGGVVARGKAATAVDQPDMIERLHGSCDGVGKYRNAKAMAPSMPWDMDAARAALPVNSEAIPQASPPGVDMQVGAPPGPIAGVTP